MQCPFPPAKLCISYLAPLSHLKPLYQKYRQHLMVKKKKEEKKKKEKDQCTNTEYMNSIFWGTLSNLH